MLTFGKSLRGDKATEENFKKYGTGYDIIHSYAHGLEDMLNPANSRLFLSAPHDTIDDGYLYAWEVYNMLLDAKLVVLAKCYSGSGQLSKGEGLLSIRRSFIFAGSQSVIMSIWIASHKPTNAILNDFYLNLLKGMRKYDALQLAKLKYLENTNPILAHSRFWAGIIVNGNQGALFYHWYLKRFVILICFILLTAVVIKYRKKIKFTCQIK